MEAAARGVAPYAQLILKHAARYGLAPSIVAGVCWQESGGSYARADGSCNPYAIRPEPGFWHRYLPAITKFVAASPSQRDDRWFKFPDIYSCSYGLMQVLYQVARERGFDPVFPHELADPDLGIKAGCAQLRFCIDQSSVRGDTAIAGLLRYNGGGDPDYARKVIAHSATIGVSGVLVPEARA